MLEFDSSYINSHHLGVLCDRMTYTHKLISIFRHGINSDNVGPIAKASFEETPKIFLEAAQFAELDIMRGISANVMCGQEGFYGTSAFQVMLDLEQMKLLQEARIQKLNEKDDVDKMFAELSPDSGDAMDPCSTASITIKNNVANIKAADIGEDTDYNPGF